MCFGYSECHLCSQQTLILALQVIFVRQHPGFFEVFLEWFASLASLLDTTLTRHAFLLICEHEHFEQLSISGFEAFKKLFVQVNQLQVSSSHLPNSLSVDTLALDGLGAVWKAALSGSDETGERPSSTELSSIVLILSSSGEAARLLLRTIYFEHSSSTNSSHDPLLVAVFRCLSFCSLALRGDLPAAKVCSYHSVIHCRD